MGLYYLGALRGLCGFWTREWLGGYKTCGVFAFLFILFAPVFPLLCLSSGSLPLLFSACPLALSLLSLWVVVSFSLADYTQKRALRVGASSLRVLWVALSGCGFIFLVLVRCQPVYIVIKF